MTDFDNYRSPFSWRYGSNEMRYIWSETHKRKLWRRIWVALAKTQAQYDLVTESQIQELEKSMNSINIDRALEIESEIHHDLMAELLTFAEQCPEAGGIIHLGATSMDVEDNADAIRIRQSLIIILDKLKALLLSLASFIEKWNGLPVMAFTHLQPAEPTTLGYRFAFYAQDLLADWQGLSSVYQQTMGKGFKGAVGTGASYIELIGSDQYDHFEEILSNLLGIPFFTVATQTYPRRQDFQVISALSSLGASLNKFAFDLRILQSPPVGELSEPFGKKQVGSSAMPFKRNPINSEKIDSLARNLSQMVGTAWNNASLSLLERTLDDSANRRTILPEAFLICDEILQTTRKIVDGLVVNHGAIKRNLALYGPFSSTERLMMALAGAGANRQELHALLRDHALNAWEKVKSGLENPLVDLVAADQEFLKYFSEEKIREFMSVEGYSGMAPKRAVQISTNIRNALSEENSYPILENFNWTGNPS